jgi:hypothetical protein
MAGKGYQFPPFELSAGLVSMRPAGHDACTRYARRMRWGGMKSEKPYDSANVTRWVLFGLAIFAMTLAGLFLT